MATATIPFDYGQILALAMQLSQSERQRLCDDLQRKPEDTFSYWFDQVKPDYNLTEEEILAECDIVREKLYRQRQYREAN